MMRNVMYLYVLAVGLLAILSAVAVRAEPPAPQVAAGKTFTIVFPDMPPTMACLLDPKNTFKPSMTVFLPTNYDVKARYPLLIFLNGGTGGNGDNPVTARKLAEDRDFICVDLPLFKLKAEDGVPTTMGMTDADCKFMWAQYRQMLDKLSQLVPNIDPARSVLGGFSNGSYATARLIVQSEGEALKRFTAFFVVESGGQLLRPDLLALLKAHPVLVLYGSQSNRPERIQTLKQIAGTDGMQFTIHEMKDTGHAFPESEFPTVRDWLRNVVLKIEVIVK